jgi:XTP/dITP diphosphohydrolase
MDQPHRIDNSQAAEAFQKLLDIMDELRDNCPWDKKQTCESLRHLTLEETYELSEAILDKDLDSLKKELGDLLLHIVFYAKIASEEKAFNINDVIRHINGKLVFRHPHIYGDVKVQDAKNVKDNWEKIKLTEGKTSVLEGVPLGLPALVKAYRIQDKVCGVGFDWEHAAQVWDKVQEELQEFKHELDRNPEHETVESEFGDLLFALVNYARFIKINPEDALEKTNRKFIKRFRYIEDKARSLGKPIHTMTLDEMNIYWEESKEMM